MVKKKSAVFNNSLNIAPKGVSGSKQDRHQSIKVDYKDVASALANSDLNSQEETGHITGLHFPAYTIVVEKVGGNKYKGWDTFGWNVRIRPKQKEHAE